MQNEKDGFSPHISLSYGKLTKLEKSKIIKNLRIKNKINLNRIAILKFSKNVNEWELVRTFGFTIPKSLKLDDNNTKS